MKPIENYPLATFREEVRELTTKQSEKSIDFLKSVEFKCSFWRNLCEPNEVISEAYLIGQNLILEGKSIPNTEAWMRKTIWNVISNNSRKKLRQEKLCFSLNSYLSNSEYDSLWTLEEIIPCKEDPNNLYVLDRENVEFREKKLKIQFLFSALKSLKPEEKRILELRFFKNLSWKEIAQELNSRQKSTNLRKKGSRALQKLRREYQRIVF